MELRSKLGYKYFFLYFLLKLHRIGIFEVFSGIFDFSLYRVTNNLNGNVDVCWQSALLCSHIRTENSKMIHSYLRTKHADNCRIISWMFWIRQLALRCLFFASTNQSHSHVAATEQSTITNSLEVSILNNTKL